MLDYELELQGVETGSLQVFTYLTESLRRPHLPDLFDVAETGEAVSEEAIDALRWMESYLAVYSEAFPADFNQQFDDVHKCRSIVIERLKAVEDRLSLQK